MKTKPIEEKIKLDYQDALDIERLKKYNGWRMVAEICAYRGIGGVSWSPPQDQIVGRALCKKASEILGRNIEDQIESVGDG